MGFTRSEHITSCESIYFLEILEKEKRLSGISLNGNTKSLSRLKWSVKSLGSFT